jgi:hypothetical protein
MKKNSWIRFAVAASACAGLVAGAARLASAEADSKAVKPCQDEIRKKAKAEHAGMDVNFESVETSAVSGDVVNVKGKFRLGKGNDSTTMNYTCRVDIKAMKVNRAEYGKEN